LITSVYRTALHTTLVCLVQCDLACIKTNQCLANG
jgi:hypothetical protein